MVGKVLKLFGWQHKIDLSPAGLDDLKITCWILMSIIVFIFGLLIPWIYGATKIMLLIF